MGRAICASLCVLILNVLSLSAGQSCFGRVEPITINCVNDCTCECDVAPAPIDCRPLGAPCMGCEGCCCPNTTCSQESGSVCVACSNLGGACNVQRVCCSGLFCTGQGICTSLGGTKATDGSYYGMRTEIGEEGDEVAPGGGRGPVERIVP